MATDDERREVAERMRMADERDAAGFDCLLANAVRGYYFCKTPCEHCHGRLLHELADLIEPSYNREVLLALADKIVADTEEDVLSEDLISAWQAGEALRDVASKIREACGVVG